eukprot:TRINITY_DN219_c0_g4_i3.p1 TRINITY_DN219_c0_g4~~TRINITY_DN219_c0_g4_i3.p1  ORF type:complete len:525 (-),score=92.30 TRINITY_DN219_c0_g4_i3:492-2066(-)
MSFRIKSYREQVAEAQRGWEQIFEKQLQEDDLFQYIISCIKTNNPVSHSVLFARMQEKWHSSPEKIQSFYKKLAIFLEQEAIPQLSKCENGNILLERLHYILYELYSSQPSLMNAELAERHHQMIDMLENHDLKTSLQKRAHELHAEQDLESIKLIIGPADSIRVFAPMKLAISSANNSDRHGAAKLEGSRVINMAINITPASQTNEQGDGPIPPVRVTIQRTSDKVIRLLCYSDLKGDFSLETEEITLSNCERLLALGPSQELYSDSKDIFRFHKYALAFVGIVRSLASAKSYILEPSLAWNDIMSFTQGDGMVLCIESVGPSRSGFSSSSSVMSAVLSALYTVSGQSQMLVQLEDLVLLAENNLGFRSGWNDTYALRAGVHHYTTQPTPDLPQPIQHSIDLADLNVDLLRTRMLIIHTGIQRQATHRMNRRHEVYLSKNPDLYESLLESFDVHDDMVDALNKNEFGRLGHLMCRYTQLRATFDHDALTPALRHFFDVLRAQGVIEGGMLAGAMGGGIAQVYR